MKTSLKKLERSVKTDRTAVLIIAVIMLISVFDLISGIVSLMSHAPSEFTIQSESLTSGIVQTSLYINGKEYGEICANNFAVEDADGNTNYRAAAVIEYIEEIVKQVIMTVILLLVYALFRNCRKMRTPFTKSAVWIVRWIAVLVIAMTFLPEVVSAIAHVVVFSYAIFDIPTANIYMLWLGCAFGMIAEIFKYGAALQEDSDSIA